MDGRIETSVSIYTAALPASIEIAGV